MPPSVKFRRGNASHSAHYSWCDKVAPKIVLSCVVGMVVSVLLLQIQLLNPQFLTPAVQPQRQLRSLGQNDDMNSHENSLLPSYASRSIPSRLPSLYRYFASCNGRRTDTASPSKEPLIALDNIRNFTSGGYEAIAKGSGVIHLIGPLITHISQLQHSAGIFGTIAEMGVHHGRFTGFLYITARNSEHLVAADLFEKLQAQNVDKSGLGDKKKFLKGLMSYGVRPSRDLRFLYEGSTDNIPEKWNDESNFHPFRMISVDAGHTAALTFNDLEVAFCNLLLGGIVILDDFFHSTWPGVTEGFFQFAAMGPEPNVYPLLRCENKLFLTNDSEFHARYYSMLLSLHDPIYNESLTTAYAHEKERGKLLYEMHGVNYLTCKRGMLTDKEIQKIWTDIVN